MQCSRASIVASMHHLDDLSLLSRVAPSDAAGGGVRAHAQDVRRGRGSSTSRDPRIKNDAHEVDVDEPIYKSLDEISSVVSSPSMSHVGTMGVATQDITAVYEGLETAFESNVRRRPATRLSSTAPVGGTQPMRSTSSPEVDKRLRMQRDETPLDDYGGASVLMYKCWSPLFPLRRGFVPAAAISATRLRQLFLYHDNRFATD